MLRYARQCSAGCDWHIPAVDAPPNLCGVLTTAQPVACSRWLGNRQVSATRHVILNYTGDRDTMHSDTQVPAKSVKQDPSCLVKVFELSGSPSSCRVLPALSTSGSLSQFG